MHVYLSFKRKVQFENLLSFQCDSQMKVLIYRLSPFACLWTVAFSFRGRCSPRSSQLTALLSWDAHISKFGKPLRDLARLVIGEACLF